MASNWGNQESLEEARRFADDVRKTGGKNGICARRSRGGDRASPRTQSQMNTSWNETSNVGRGGPVHGSWNGFNKSTATTSKAAPALATAPPAHLFVARPGPEKYNISGAQSTDQQPPAFDEMDIDELPQVPSSGVSESVPTERGLNGSGLVASRWGPAHGTNATQTTVSAPAKASTNSARQSAQYTKPHVDYGVDSSAASINRSPSPKMGMAASIWASSPVAVTLTQPSVDSHFPAPPTNLVIDNDWQTTYLIENNGRIYAIAARNAAQAGDVVAEKQLNKVEKLFEDIVKARRCADAAGERSACADARAAIKLACSALDKFKRPTTAQQSQRSEKAPNASTAHKDEKALGQQQLDQTRNQVSYPLIQSSQRLQPLRQEQHVPATPRKQSFHQDFFDDQETHQLWNNFMKRDEQKMRHIVNGQNSSACS